MYTDRLRKTQMDKKTEKTDTDRYTDRQADRHTDRQTENETESPPVRPPTKSNRVHFLLADPCQSYTSKCLFVS